MSYETLSRFSFHKPDQDAIDRMKRIRIKVRALAFEIEALCPASREKQTALTQLSFVMMSANSAIVQAYPIDEKDLTPEERGIYDLDPKPKKSKEATDGNGSPV